MKYAKPKDMILKVKPLKDGERYTIIRQGNKAKGTTIGTKK